MISYSVDLDARGGLPYRPPSYEGPGTKGLRQGPAHPSRSIGYVQHRACEANEREGSQAGPGCDRHKRYCRRFGLLQSRQIWGPDPGRRRNEGSPNLHCAEGARGVGGSQPFASSQLGKEGDRFSLVFMVPGRGIGVVGAVSLYGGMGVIGFHCFRAGVR